MVDSPGYGNRDESEWVTSGIELEALFGAVVGRVFDAEWAALDGPDLVAARESEIPDLYAADAEAERVSERMRAALAGVGFTAADFPQLHGKVNTQGAGASESGVSDLSHGGQ